MQYKKIAYLPREMSKEDAVKLMQHHRSQFITEALDKGGMIEDGAFFTIRYMEKYGEAFDVYVNHFIDDLNEFRMCVEIEPVWMYKAVYHSPEERYFRPEPSMKQKLKNCLAYLKDKTGGKIEMEEK